jgi:predicted nucleotidyltransferase component of viral defense system
MDSSNARTCGPVSEVLSRSQRRIIASVMSSIEQDGFVMAGGSALIESGVSERPTEDLDAFSASCDDVDAVAKRLVDDLDRGGYVAVIQRSSDSFAQLTVSTGQWRRTELRVELGRDSQLMDSVPSALGPMLSLRELAANKVLAAFGRHEPRDLVDLQSISGTVPLQQAFADAVRKDPGFDVEVFREMVSLTVGVRDDLWPKGSDPDLVRSFIRDELLTTEP